MSSRFRFSRQAGQDNKYFPGGGRRGVGRIDGTRGPRRGNLRESPVTFSHQVIDLAHATLVEGVCAVDSCHPRPSEAGRVKGQNQLPLRTPPQHPSLAGCDGYSTQHLATVGGRRYRLQPPSRRGERASSSSSCLRTSWRWSSPSSRRLTRAPSTRAGVVRIYQRWYRPWGVILLSVQGSPASPLDSTHEGMLSPLWLTFWTRTGPGSPHFARSSLHRLSGRVSTSPPSVAKPTLSVSLPREVVPPPALPWIFPLADSSAGDVERDRN